MITLFQINSCVVGSTGTIMIDIDSFANRDGMMSFLSSPRSISQNKNYPDNYIFFGNVITRKMHRNLAKITGNEGGYSFFATKFLLKKIDELHPDIIQLHNLHSNFVNLDMLFNYLKKNPNIKVVWTLHDCWAFTGNCPYYDMNKCDNWQKECHNCKVYKQYSYIDNSNRMFLRKRNLYSEMKNLTLVTPSKWLYDEVDKSFLCGLPKVIIKNGIDINTFKKTRSTFRSKYGLDSKFIIMGSAFVWCERKGFDVFIKLAELLDEDYKIVLIGGFNNVQLDACKQYGILTIPATESKEFLAELYSASDVFFNPTREEMFGLVNIESQACGTPVITFKSGGSPECIGEDCGYVVEKEDLSGSVELMKKIKSEGKPSYRKMRKWVEGFSSENIYRQYIGLYHKLVNGEDIEE